MPKKFTVVRIDDATQERLKATSKQTGISMARIAADGINKELTRLEEIFSQAEKNK